MGYNAEHTLANEYIRKVYSHKTPFILLAVAGQHASASDAPFSTVDTFDGDFDGAYCVYAADVNGRENVPRILRIMVHYKKTRVIASAIGLSVLLAVAVQHASATEVPFSDINIIEGEFGGAFSVYVADVESRRFWTELSEVTHEHG